MDLFNFAWNYLSFIIARFYGIKVAIIAGICPNTVIARSRHDFVAIHKENIRIAGIVYDSVESPCDSAVLWHICVQWIASHSSECSQRR